MKFRATDSDVNKPRTRFRVQSDFLERRATGVPLENAQHQMAIARRLVVRDLLFVRKIPMRVEPVRVARGQQEPPCAV